MDVIARFDNVTKRYFPDGAEVLALDHLTLDVHSRQFVALAGRSGCGKSTLLNLAGAMDLPTSGHVLLLGQSTSSLTPTQLTRIRRHQVGFVFQSFQLMPTLTAVENVELPLLLAQHPQARRTALERLAWVGLDPQASRFPHQLSGGQQQRVAIARALAHNPSLLLADEPTGNLDSATGTLILDLLRRITSELGTTILMATHSPESLAKVDRIVRLKDGRVESVQEAGCSPSFTASS